MIKNIKYTLYKKSAILELFTLLWSVREIKRKWTEVRYNLNYVLKLVIEYDIRLI